MRLNGMVKKRRFKLFILAVIVISIYAFMNLHNWAWYNRPTSHECKTPNKEMDDLVSLAHDTKYVLEQLNLTNFLIYGSMWGALRYNAPLPWDNDVDIGLRYIEMTPEKEKKLFNELNKKNIRIFYRYWFGTYRVLRATARGDLMLFRENYFGNYVRLGMESWVFFINYRKHHTFPASLIEKPLPTLPFAGVNFRVPRDGIEIQKYFYPDDWWKESKPSGCEL